MLKGYETAVESNSVAVEGREHEVLLREAEHGGSSYKIQVSRLFARAHQATQVNALRAVESRITAVESTECC